MLGEEWSYSILRLVSIFLMPDLDVDPESWFSPTVLCSVSKCLLFYLHNNFYQTKSDSKQQNFQCWWSGQIFALSNTSDIVNWDFCSEMRAGHGGVRLSFVKAALTVRNSARTYLYLSAVLFLVMVLRGSAWISDCSLPLSRGERRGVSRKLFSFIQGNNFCFN